MNYFELFAELGISLISSRNIIIRLSNIIYSTNSQVLQSDSPIRTNSIHSYTFYIACIRFILSLKSYFIGQCKVNVRSIKVILLSNIWKGYQTSVKNVLMTNHKRMACQVVLNCSIYEFSHSKISSDFVGCYISPLCIIQSNPGWDWVNRKKEWLKY